MSWIHVGSTGPSIQLGTIPVVPFVSLPYFMGPTEVGSHFHVIGLTGAGKSKLLAHYAASLILQGRGVSVIDPHGDLAVDVLRLLHGRGYFRRRNALDRLLYVDFTHPHRHLPFNILKQPYSIYETARLVVEACMRAWPALADGQAPTFENVLLASVTVLIANRLPLTAMTRLLTDAAYREALLRQVTDAEVVSFFRDRFARWGREAPLLIESTLRRIFLLAYSPALRDSLSQQENALDIPALMKAGVSLICNLGGLDEQTQRLLGCLLAVSFETAALARAQVPDEQRTPHTLIIDEFAAFSVQSEEALSRVLSSARKFRLSLVLAHQTFSQLSTRLQGGLHNTIPIAFRLSREDALWMAPRYGAYDPLQVKHVVEDDAQVPRTHPLFYSVQETYEGWARELMNLRPREMYIRVGDRTVKLRTPTVSPIGDHADEVARLQALYADRLLVPREQVDHDGGPTPRPVSIVRSVPSLSRTSQPNPTRGGTRAHMRVVPLPCPTPPYPPRARSPGASPDAALPHQNAL